MRYWMAAAALTALVAGTGAAHAQSTAIEGRVDRLEREMRAVQRKVFPGGAGQTIEPQIVPDASIEVPGTPAGTPLADLTQRVAALENQVQTLTGQVEQDGYRLKQLEDGFAAYKRATDPAHAPGGRGEACAQAHRHPCAAGRRGREAQ